MIKRDQVHVLAQRVDALEAVVSKLEAAAVEQRRRHEQTLVVLLGLVERNGEHLARAEHLFEKMDAAIERLGPDGPTLQ